MLSRPAQPNRLWWRSRRARRRFWPGFGRPATVCGAMSGRAICIGSPADTSATTPATDVGDSLAPLFPKRH